MDADANTTPVPAAEYRHRLRTPLNHLIGYGEMLREDYPAWSPQVGAILEESGFMLDSLQQAATGDAPVLSPGALSWLRQQMSGAIERVARRVRELRKEM
ncbi:MAG: hypothetical protein KGN84_15305, partial [Acidobacteriota bacterium]|nr:hypothetical protein [Acidobacteriota bacterium]